MSAERSTGWDGILQEGETILWQGQPAADIAWQDLLSPKTAFGAIFTAFSLFWMGAAFFMVTAGGADGPFVLFPLFGLPFLAIGLYMVGGRVWLDAWRRARTWYTLTDRTAFVATDFLGRKTLDSYPLAEMPHITLDDGDPGSILFGRGGRSVRGSAHRIEWRAAEAAAEPAGFREIRDARRVYAMMRDARRALRQNEAE